MDTEKVWVHVPTTKDRHGRVREVMVRRHLRWEQTLTEMIDLWLHQHGAVPGADAP